MPSLMTPPSGASTSPPRELSLLRHRTEPLAGPRRPPHPRRPGTSTGPSVDDRPRMANPLPGLFLESPDLQPHETLASRHLAPAAHSSDASGLSDSGRRPYGSSAATCALVHRTKRSTSSGTCGMPDSSRDPCGLAPPTTLSRTARSAPPRPAPAARRTPGGDPMGPRRRWRPMPAPAARRDGQRAARARPPRGLRDAAVDGPRRFGEAAGLAAPAARGRTRPRRLADADPALRGRDRAHALGPAACGTSSGSWPSRSAAAPPATLSDSASTSARTTAARAPFRSRPSAAPATTRSRSSRS
jgi:hypothetical protein